MRERGRGEKEKENCLETERAREKGEKEKETCLETERKERPCCCKKVGKKTKI
jgi:hypothetical protein